MSKKLLPLVIVILLALVLAGCGGSEPTVEEAPVEEAPAPETAPEEAAEPAGEKSSAEETAGEAEVVTLNILHNWGPDDPKGPILQSIIERFEAENPDVVIAQEILPDDEIFTKVEVSFVGGEEADLVFQNYFGPALEWVDDGVTIPVSAYVDEWGLAENYLDAALTQYTRSDGEIAAFPLEGFNWPVWYNAAIFEEAGVPIPTTAEDMVAAAEAIRAAGYQPFSTGGSDWTGARLSQMFLVSGLPDDEARTLLANGGFGESVNAQKAMETFVEWRDNGVFADNAEGLEFSSMNELFFSGQAAMVHAGSWSFSELPEELQDSVVLGGLPVTDLGAFGKPTAWAGFTAKGVHITRNGAEKMDPVERFVTYLFQPENMATFVEQAGLIPPFGSVDVDETVLNPLFVASLSLPETTDFVLLAETVIPGPIIEQWDKVANDSFIPNGMSAEEILTALDDLYAEYQ